jgi:hypothetical protein
MFDGFRPAPAVEKTQFESIAFRVAISRKRQTR